MDERKNCEFDSLRKGYVRRETFWMGSEADRQNGAVA